MELGLKSNEIREARSVDGATVQVYAVGGGSFTHVRVSGPNGVPLHTKSHRFESEALRDYAEQKAHHAAAEAVDDAMEA